MWTVLARHCYRRLLLLCSTPCGARARYVVCVSTSSLSSIVIDVFDTLPRSRAICGNVIAIVASHCRVRHPAALARDMWSVLARHRYCRLSLTGLTRCRARCVVLVRTSSLSLHGNSGRQSCHCYYRRGQCSQRLSPDWARNRTRCMVCPTTSSLSSFVIDVFNTLPGSRVMCGLY